MASGGLAQRFVDFVTGFLEPLNPPATGRREPTVDRYRLARQLLGTLSSDVLSETGHLKARQAPPPPHRRRGVDPRNGPPPRAVGDLARPRPDAAP